MLTKDEEDFLNKIPADKKVHVYPFGPKVAKVVEDLIQSINNIYPDLEVKHMGASALGISGQNDIDIYALSHHSDFGKYLPGLINLFGEPLHKHETFIEWKFNENNYPIELYLTKPPERHIRVFEMLKNNKNLLKEYEDLKTSMNGKSFKEYQEKKYGFYHKILDSNILVRESYNKIADDYFSTRDQFKNLKHLKRLNSLLKRGSTILNIGCGAGVPIDKYLVEKGHHVIGIDISFKQIDLARKNVPQGKFEVKDMSGLKENEFHVDAVVSFYTIFHIPREKHLELLQKVNSFLPKGGLILITMGATEWEGTEEFHGTKMFWSHYGTEKNRELVIKAGFNVIFDEINSSGGEKHLIILARKV